MILTFEDNEEKVNFKRRFSCVCKQCGLLSEYSEPYDAYFCPDCNIWLEGQCLDPECKFCADRPANPIPEGG